MKAKQECHVRKRRKCAQWLERVSSGKGRLVVGTLESVAVKSERLNREVSGA